MAAERSKPPATKMDDAQWLSSHAIKRVDKKTGEATYNLNQAGALDLAHDDELSKISTTMLVEPTEANGWTARFRATVTTRRGTFEAHGSANPATTTVTLTTDRKTNPTIQQLAIAEMAETRALVRALRWATNNGQAAVEEGIPVDDEEPAPISKGVPAPEQDPFAAELERWDREIEWVEPDPKSPSPPTQIRPPDDSPASVGQRLAISRAAEQLGDPIDDAQLEALTDGAARELLTQLQQTIVERRRANQASKRAAAR